MYCENTASDAENEYFRKYCARRRAQKIKIKSRILLFISENY